MRNTTFPALRATRRGAVAWIAALSLAFTLTACGGSSSSSDIASTSGKTVVDDSGAASSPPPADQPASSTSADQPASDATPASDAAPASDATPASDPAPASTPAVAPAPGFSVGTTTFDPDLPPEPTLPASTQICKTLNASLTSQSNGLLPDSTDAADTARIQAALDACKNTASTGLSTNKVVRLASGPNGENAFLGRAR